MIAINAGSIYLPNDLITVENFVDLCEATAKMLFTSPGEANYILGNYLFDLAFTVKTRAFKELPNGNLLFLDPDKTYD